MSGMPEMVGSQPTPQFTLMRRATIPFRSASAYGLRKGNHASPLLVAGTLVLISEQPPGPGRILGTTPVVCHPTARSCRHFSRLADVQMEERTVRMAVQRAAKIQVRWLFQPA